MASTRDMVIREWSFERNEYITRRLPQTNFCDVCGRLYEGPVSAGDHLPFFECQLSPSQLRDLGWVLVHQGTHQYREWWRFAGAKPQIAAPAPQIPMSQQQLKFRIDLPRLK